MPSAPFNSAAAACQIEGSSRAAGDDEDLWDWFARKPAVIVDGSTGNVACDSFHPLRDVVRPMKELGVQVNRFSLAWSRNPVPRRCYSSLGSRTCKASTSLSICAGEL
ncbi:MAG: family 1 glycosylhydrolase [Aestuariivirga sp.]